MECDLGLLGIGVMGQNLALNFQRNGYAISVYNRTTEKTRKFVSQHPEIIGASTLQQFVDTLSRPRRILLMVTAGAAVDATLNDLSKLLAKDDVVMDGGNSFFRDTDRRFDQFTEQGLHYLGIGISGGEEGALRGPCMMAGGSRRGYDQIVTMLADAAAKAEGSCCEFLGPRGAGHYVKMVHNGIEYAVIQIIAEAYDLLFRCAQFNVVQIQKIFAEWSRGELNSFLMEIASKVLEHVDPETHSSTVSLILDSAKQKGTGKWTSQNSMDLGIPTPTIDAAVGARNMSGLKAERVVSAKLYKRSAPTGVDSGFVEQLRNAVQASIIVSYAQGFHLMRTASAEYAYYLPMIEIARIWKGGCIIRAKLLDSIKQAFMSDENVRNIIVDPEIAKVLSNLLEDWRSVISIAKSQAIPAPAMGASLDYLDGYKSERLPANFVQALRDYFGAHGYERIDRPGHFHTDWT